MIKKLAYNLYGKVKAYWDKQIANIKKESQRERAQLFIFLSATVPTRENDYQAFTIDSDHVIQLVTADPESIALAANNREVIVVIPAHLILITTVQLPKLKSAQLLQAVPFALEDQLLHDITTEHFAVGNYLATGALPVAIIQKNILEQLLMQLKTWQIVPDRIIPDCYFIPARKAEWHIILHEHALVRINDHCIFNCELADLNFLLLATLEREETPHIVYIDNYTTMPIQLTLPAEIEIITTNCVGENYFYTLLQHIPHDAINLLQGEFTVKKPTYQFKHLSKPLKMAVAIWFGLLLLYPSVSYLMLEAKLSSLHNQINAIYKRNFPQAQSIIAPRMRMEEKLANFSSGLQQNTLLTLLHDIGQAMSRVPTLTINQIDFRDNLLHVSLNATSSQDLTTFMNVLTQQGLHVKQDSAVMNQSQIQTVITIEN